MNDKQQIEEMAKDIYYAIQKECKLNTYGHCNDCEFNVPENTNEIDCQSYLVSKILSQMNYRKISEDCVVLTREEYSDYLILQQNHEFIREKAKELQADNERLYKNIGKFKDSVRKETAREILDEFNNFLPDRATSNIEIKKDSLEDVRKALTVLAQAYHDKTQELAKQYGVEVKE